MSCFSGGYSDYRRTIWQPRKNTFGCMDAIGIMLPLECGFTAYIHYN